MAKNWIKGAIKHPGALHRELGVPEGKKIPAKKIEKASHSDNPTLARRANLAKTLGKMHHSQPHPKTNPGDYDYSAHTKTHHGDSGKALGVKGDLDGPNDISGRTNEERGIVVAQDTDGARHHPNFPSTGHKFSPPAAAGAHGFGYSASQRAGFHRNSGHKGAHRVGKR